MIVSDKEKPSRLKIMERFGTPVTIGVDIFAKEIKKQMDSYTPPIIKNEKPYLCFVCPNSSNIRPKIQDKAIWDLFFWGIPHIDILKYSYNYSPDYLYYVISVPLKSEPVKY